MVENYLYLCAIRKNKNYRVMAELRIYITISEKAGHELTFQSNEPRDKYNHQLFLLRGKRIKVETDYLFLNQFNTPPIKGVSELGLRVMAKDVSKIEIKNRTFNFVKKKIKERYLNDWGMKLDDKQLSCWEYLVNK